MGLLSDWSEAGKWRIVGRIGDNWERQKIWEEEDGRWSKWWMSDQEWKGWWRRRGKGEKDLKVWVGEGVRGEIALSPMHLEIISQLTICYYSAACSSHQWICIKFYPNLIFNFKPISDPSRSSYTLPLVDNRHWFCCGAVFDCCWR